MQGLAFQQLEHDVHHRALVPVVMDCDDVRMRESGYGTRLAVKACHRVGIGRQPLWQDLDRDISAESGIPRSIHFTHATGTEGGDNLIGAEARSWGKGHGSMHDYRTAESEAWGRGLVPPQAFQLP